MFNHSFGGHFLDECIFSCELLALHMVDSVITSSFHHATLLLVIELYTHT